MTDVISFSRLIMDGKLVLTRIVRKQTMAFEVLDSHGDASNVAVDCLAPELTPRPLYGVLCNDLFVLCRDPSNGQDPNASVDLWAVLRMQTMPQPTSIVHGNSKFSFRTFLLHNPMGACFTYISGPFSLTDRRFKGNFILRGSVHVGSADMVQR